MHFLSSKIVSFQKKKLFKPSYPASSRRSSSSGLSPPVPLGRSVTVVLRLVVVDGVFNL
jgi:hypothetical protein